MHRGPVEALARPRRSRPRSPRRSPSPSRRTGRPPVPLAEPRAAPPTVPPRAVITGARAETLRWVNTGAAVRRCQRHSRALGHEQAVADGRAPGSAWSPSTFGIIVDLVAQHLFQRLGRPSSCASACRCVPDRIGAWVAISGISSSTLRRAARALAKIPIGSSVASGTRTGSAAGSSGGDRQVLSHKGNIGRTRARATRLRHRPLRLEFPAGQPLSRRACDSGPYPGPPNQGRNSQWARQSLNATSRTSTSARSATLTTARRR